MMRKGGENSIITRKGNINGRSFQDDINSTTIGSPKGGNSNKHSSSHYNGSSNRRPASQRKLNMVQNMP